MSKIKIEQLLVEDFEQALTALSQILYACVCSGASVGFVQPFSVEQSEAFWNNKVAPDLTAENAYLFVAKDEDLIVGCVQLSVNMPPNQQHRAEVAKMLVHPDYQRKGIAKKLMQSIEDKAQQLAKSLLVLDTKTGDVAEGFYQKLGFNVVGSIPGFAQNTALDGYASTTVMYKQYVHKTS